MTMMMFINMIYIGVTLGSYGLCKRFRCNPTWFVKESDRIPCHVVCQMDFSAYYSVTGGGDEDDAVHVVDCEERVSC